MTHQVEITVEEDGATQIEVKGCAGKQCADITRDVERALGNVKGDVKKPEFYQQTKVNQKAQQ
jgi:hypothetical protein